MATTTGLMAVEQYRELPEAGPFYHELRQGELVQVSRPKAGHLRILERIRRLLSAAFGQRGAVMVELPFRATGENDLRAADVAFVTRERWQSVGDTDDLFGAPDLTVEVLSPSNTATEINENIALCLENGCREFWVVDPRLHQVQVSTPDGLTRTYRAGDRIWLISAEGQVVLVDSILVDE